MRRQHVAVSCLVVFQFSCGALESEPQTPTSLETGASLDETFNDAARAYQVPVEALKAIAWVETRVSQPEGPSLTQSHGVMQLSSREDWNTLRRASQLTGVPEETLKTDARKNIFGAAAVLRELFDESMKKYPELKPSSLGDLYHAISLYPGFDSASNAQDYAAEVFSVIDQGFEVSLPDGVMYSEGKTSDWRRHAPTSIRQDALVEYPNAYQWKRSPNFRAGRTSYDYVVIHTTQGAYHGAISWFQNTQSKASSHYVVRSSDGQITQMVEHEDTAWHAGCFNPKSIGIEHEGFVENPQRWYTDAMYEESARLTRWVADRHNIPLDRSHIIGHVEIAPECNRNRHYDPGPGWNWTKYMGLVTGTEATVGQGKLTGVVYREGNSKLRLEGAIVKCNGATKTTGKDGSYTFVLPPGAYTVEVSKDGYQPQTASNLVTEKQTTWSSVSLSPDLTGKWVGIAYEFDFLKSVSQSKPLVGARVKTGSTVVTASATGYFELTLPVGTHTIEVSHPNYYTQYFTRTVVANEKVWGSAGLLPVVSTVARPISIEITEPAPDSSHDIAIHRLRGTVVDSHQDVQKVSVRVNGGQPTEVAVVQGAFDVPMKLAPGENTFEVTAVSVLGTSAATVAKMTFEPGLVGEVYESSQGDSLLTDATVELLDVETGETAAMVRTNAQGRFQLVPPTVPATYRLVVRKNGYLTSLETIDVPDDRRLQVKLPLTKGEMAPPSEVGIEWTQPLSESVVTTDRLQVYGSVVGLQPISVTVNSVPAELLGAGGFFAQVPLKVGRNELVASAMGPDGETITGRLTVVRGGAEEAEPLTASCSSTNGLWAWAGLTWVVLRRRRKATVPSSAAASATPE